MYASGTTIISDASNSNGIIPCAEKGKIVVDKIQTPQVRRSMQGVMASVPSLSRYSFASTVKYKTDVQAGWCLFIREIYGAAENPP